MENFLGEIRLFAGTFAPQGWHLCDGSELSINQNEALFTLLATYYGGDGKTTFGLPDLRGRVPVHIGTGSGGLTPIVLGAVAGGETVTLNADNLPAHSHALMATVAAGTSASAAGAVIASSTNTVYVTNSTPPTSPPVPTPVAMNSASIDFTGKSYPVSIIQPSGVVNYIIATVGNFPSQS